MRIAYHDQHNHIYLDDDTAEILLHGVVVRIDRDTAQWLIEALRNWTEE